MSDHDHPPYGSYELLTGLFNVAAWTFASRLERRAPKLADLLLLGVATQQVSRTVSRSRVTSPIRAPFVEHGPDGDEVPKPGGLRRALGELLTCPFCLAPWTALTLTGAYAIAPRTTRGFASIMTVAAISDFLNRAYGRLSKPAPREPEPPALELPPPRSRSERRAEAW